MPEIDGAALLKTIRTRSPATARIIMTGQTGAEAMMRVITMAHLFLDKPVDSHQVVEAIEHVLTLRQGTGSANPDMLGDICGLNSLPSPPRLLTQLLAVLDDEAASASSIGEIIEGDPAIAAKILHLANSAAYTTGRHLGEVSQAVALLGTSTVRGLVMMHDIVDAFAEKVNLPSAWMETMNTHSVQTARLAARICAGKASAGASFTAGLLHEVGQLVLATARPDGFGSIIARWQDADQAAPGAATATSHTETREAAPVRLGDLENAALGTSHAHAGAQLLSLWGLPTDIVEAAAQHATAQPPTSADDLSSAVALAHALVEAELGAVCGTRPANAIEDDELGATERCAVQRWRASLQPSNESG